MPRLRLRTKISRPRKSRTDAYHVMRPLWTGITRSPQMKRLVSGSCRLQSSNYRVLYPHISFKRGAQFRGNNSHFICYYNFLTGQVEATGKIPMDYKEINSRSVVSIFISIALDLHLEPA